MVYREVEPIGRAEAEALLASGDPGRVVYGLLRSAYFDPDGRWVLEQCIQFSTHPDANVRAMCATAVGHLARLQRLGERRRARSLLRALARDPLSDVAGAAQDALDDLRRRQARPRRRRIVGRE